MSKGLGKLQRDVLSLLPPGREVELYTITITMSGIDPEEWRDRRKPSKSLYSAVSRAIASLRKRSLITTRYQTDRYETGRHLLVRKC